MTANLLLRSAISLLAATLLACFSSGCVATTAIYFAGNEFVAYEDRLVAIDGAWIDETRLVVAFRGEMGEMPYQYEEHGDVEREVFPSPWWFEVPLIPTKADGIPLPVGHRGPIRWDKGLDSWVDREALREGVPPPETLAGMRALPVIEASSKIVETREESRRVAWAAARHGVVFYSPGLWIRSRLHGGDKTIFFGVARFDSEKREVELDEFHISRRVEYPNKNLGLLFPLAMAVDIVLLPVVLPITIVAAFIATA